VEEIGSSEVGSSGRVGLLEKVVRVLLAVEAGTIKESSGFLLSSRVAWYRGVYYQGVYH